MYDYFLKKQPAAAKFCPPFIPPLFSCPVQAVYALMAAIRNYRLFNKHTAVPYFNKDCTPTSSICRAKPANLIFPNKCN
jgi:hypothetical protein